jgi:hypothetical protein
LGLNPPEDFEAHERQLRELAEGFEAEIRFHEILYGLGPYASVTVESDSNAAVARFLESIRAADTRAAATKGELWFTARERNALR